MNSTFPRLSAIKSRVLYLFINTKFYNLKFILLRTYYMSLSNNNGEYQAIDFGTCNSVISLIQKRFYKKLKIIYVSKP